MIKIITVYIKKGLIIFYCFNYFYLNNKIYYLKSLLKFID